MRFGRRVEHREQHLEDAHTDHEQDGEREPANRPHGHLVADDHADREPDQHRSVNAKNNFDGNDDNGGIANDSNDDDEGPDRHGCIRHDDNRDLENANGYHDSVRHDDDTVDDEDRNCHRPHDDGDDDRDANQHDDDTDDHDDDREFLQSRGCCCGGGRGSVQGGELLGLGLSSRVGVGADRRRRGRRHRRRGRRHPPPAAEQAIGAPEPGAGAADAPDRPDCLGTPHTSSDTPSSASSAKGHCLSSS